MKALVLGGSSFVGRHLVECLGPARAVGTFFAHPVARGLYYDARHTRIADLIDGHDFSHAVILFGNANPDSCARDPERTRQLNVERTKEAIEEICASNIVPVFASTESVFDGARGGYSETDAVRPLLRYAAQKVEIEQFLQEHCDRYLILRLGRVFGSRRGDGTLLTAWLEQLEANRDIRCASDQVFSPIPVSEVSAGIVELMQRDCAGIFHLCGTEAMNRCRMLEALMAQYERYRPCGSSIVPCRLADFETVEARPLDLSMKPDKIIDATGITIRPFGEWCEIVTRTWYGADDTDQTA